MSKRINTIVIIVVLLVLLIFAFVALYQGYKFVIRIKPSSACTADGICSKDVITSTLGRINDKLQNIANIYCAEHKINKPIFVVREGIESYAEHKREIFLCLRSHNNVTYSDNTLMEVGIHELSHVLCPESKHTLLFYQIYNELIEIAEKEKYYDKKIPMEKGYCGYNT